MNRRAAFRLALVAALATGALLATAVGAFAIPASTIPAPTLSIDHVSFKSRTVDFASTYETGTATVALFVDSAEVTRTSVPADARGSVMLPAELPLSCTIEAVGYDQSGSAIGTSTAIAFDGTHYAPKSVSLPYSTNHLVRPSTAFRISTSDRVTHATLYLSGNSVWYGAVDVTNGAAILPAVSVRYGRSTVRVVVSNAWGSVPSPIVPIYQLGKSLPPYWRYVLIDKSDFYLYYVTGSKVSSRYPIAIGTPWSPTPNGTFRLWYPQRSSGVWGVMRMPLQRRVRGGFVRTAVLRARDERSRKHRHRREPRLRPDVQPGRHGSRATAAGLLEATVRGDPPVGSRGSARRTHRPLAGGGYSMWRPPARSTSARRFA